ncbi:MAG: adenylate/guanylate cyclase domain-containing protein [Deltaproteobacteria bacterium]|nr:adenylate/guanylate cyclase domain-containing protein [Myxococcales bacterium]MDP3213290.1 adenylate/guanylate cyclase domain-containing protein [Deltaproteobacteria bacterium]
MPLRVRWTGALLAVALLPLAALAAVTLRIQRSGLHRAEQELELAVCDRVGDALDRDLDYAGEATLRLGRVLTEGRIADDEARLFIAREIMARAAALQHVAVYTPAGDLVDTIARVGESREPAAPARIPEEVQRRRPEFGEWAAPAFDANGVTLRVVVALLREGQLRGWVVGTVSPRWIEDTVASISRDRFGAPDRVLVVDPTLRLLSRGPGAAPGASLAGREIFTRVQLPPEAFARPLQLTEDYLAAEPMVGSLRTLPERRWAVLVRRPEREVFLALYASRRLLIGGSLALAALAVLVGAWLGARTTRPIAGLVALTRAYAARHFEARSTVRTGDELEALGGAMESMADTLVASEREVGRLARVEGDLSRYLPAEVAQAVALGRASLALGGDRRRVTVLFADVVAFTAFAEQAPPEKVVAFLNELFTVLTEVVFRHGGMVDKFIGDCVMAVWGAGSAALDDEAQRRAALETAEDMHRFVEASAPEWRERYGIDVSLGIGVHTGDALLGNLGSETRMEYTAIGDVVNVAARLESLARGAQTLVTAEVTAGMSGDFTFSPLGPHALRGKSAPVEIFEVMS